MNDKPDSNGGSGEKRIFYERMGNFLERRDALNVWRGVEAIRVPDAAAGFAPHLDELHGALDEAVYTAWGWRHERLTDDEGMLRQFLALKLARAGALS